MKQRLYLILILFFMMGTLSAAEPGLIGDWKGSRCSSYDDSTSFGTYNWSFTSTTVNTYIQYHANRLCNHPTLKLNQANGTYQLEKNNDGYSDYILTVQFTHLSYPLIFNVLKTGETVLLTNAQNGITYTLIEQ